MSTFVLSRLEHPAKISNLLQEIQRVLGLVKSNDSELHMMPGMVDRASLLR